MNWLAWDPRSYGGAVLGGVLGTVAFKLALDAGVFAPWLIGLGLGLGCAVLTEERATTRGIVLAIVAAWGSAIAQCLWMPQTPGESLLDGLLAFHATLAPGRLAGYVAGMAAAFVLGRTSLRAGASVRVHGAGRER